MLMKANHWWSCNDIKVLMERKVKRRGVCVGVCVGSVSKSNEFPADLNTVCVQYGCLSISIWYSVCMYSTCLSVCECMYVHVRVSVCFFCLCLFLFLCGVLVCDACLFVCTVCMYVFVCACVCHVMTRLHWTHVSVTVMLWSHEAVSSSVLRTDELKWGVYFWIITGWFSTGDGESLYPCVLERASRLYLFDLIFGSLSSTSHVILISRILLKRENLSRNCKDFTVNTSDCRF